MLNESLKKKILINRFPFCDFEFDILISMLLYWFGHKLKYVYILNLLSFNTYNSL